MRLSEYLNKKEWQFLVVEGYVLEAAKPELKDGEYAVRMAGKQKVRALNPKSNRMKNFKRDKWIKTTVEPEERSFKNLPRYADKKVKVRFQDWLGIKGNPGKGFDGKWYGYSHRAVHGFGVGDVIKKGHIGNKYEYTKEVSKKYNELYDADWKNGTKKSDEYLKSIKFEPYTIKTDQEAKEHAERFMRGVS